MADANSSKSSVPILETFSEGNQLKTKLPDGVKANNSIYAIEFEGNYWTGEFQEGDLIFVDPTVQPTAGEYAVIYPLEMSDKPFVELLYMGYLQDAIAETTDGNAIPLLAVSRPAGTFKAVECGKLAKIHKVVGKAKPHVRQLEEC